MMTLTGRTRTKTMEVQVGTSILDHAIQSGIDWQYNCSRGTCARCRCIVTAGAELLAEPTDAEWDRLDPEEFDAGFRLGCQAVLMKQGELVAANRPYF